MTLYAQLSVNSDEAFATAVISNLGHPDGKDPKADDLRLYCYDIMTTGKHVDDCPSGEVLHRRSEGAWELLRKVLNDAAPSPSNEPKAPASVNFPLDLGQ